MVLNMRNTKQIEGLKNLIDEINFCNKGILLEIGSWIGESSLIFSENFFQVICVDPWDEDLAIKIGCSPYLSDNEDIEDIFNIFLKNISSIDNICYIRGTSLYASRFFPNNSIDVIYLDGDHSFDAVLEDITIWKPKLKNNGFFCGHDYSKSWPGVISAVNKSFKNVKTFKDTSWLVNY